MRSTQDIIEFAKVNQYFMTQAEMAAELGISLSLLRKICGDTLIPQAQWCKDYIKANPGKTVQQYARLLDITEASVKAYCEDIGVEVLTEKQQGRWEEMTDEEIDIALDQHRMELGFYRRVKRDRFKDKYTQSGSPYGIADDSSLS